MTSSFNVIRPIGFSIFFVIAIFACKSSQSITSDFNLLNCWKHSYEEDVDGFMIYRPCDYKTFPASRYRNTFKLMESGESSYLVLAPTDRHYMEDGQWTYNASSKVLTISNKSGETQLKCSVVEIAKDKLRIKKF